MITSSAWYFLLAAGCADAPRAGSPDHLSPAATHALVVVLDGVRLEESLGDGWSDVAVAPTGTLLPATRSEVVPLGTRVLPAYNVGPTVTAPSHATLVTGAYQAFANLPVDGEANTYVPDYPTLFELAREAGGSAALVANSMLPSPVSQSAFPGLGDGADFELVAHGEGGPHELEPDPVVLARALEVLRTFDRGIVLANLHEMDRLGHDGGDDDYVEAVRQVDAPLAATWAAIEADPLLGGHTLLVVVADHGRGRGGVDAWRDHGDASRGCREIPLLLVGPGVHRDLAVTGTTDLADVGATIAHVLGLPLVAGQGRAITSALVRPPPRAGATGQREVRLAGAHELTLEALDADDRRSEIRLDGERLSSADAWAVWGPALAEGGGAAYACWDELVIEPGAGDLPWRAQCVAIQDGAWVPIGFPEPVVGPFLRRAMAVDDLGGLWVAYDDNDRGGATDGDGETLRLRRYLPERGWDQKREGVPGVVFAEGIDLTLHDGTALVSLATSFEKATARAERHPEVWQVYSEFTGEQVWTRLFDGAEGKSKTQLVDDAGLVWNRVENTAVEVDDSTTRLVATAYQAGATEILAFDQDASGEWALPRALDRTGRVLPTVRPRVRGGVVWWARLGSDGPEVCRAAASDAARCTSVDGVTVGDVQPEFEGARVTVLDSSRRWSVVKVE